MGTAWLAVVRWAIPCSLLPLASSPGHSSPKVVTSPKTSVFLSQKSASVIRYTLHVYK